ncbi:MAG: carboxypeptidase regulatory-like domain-containing protein [Bryobacterales bacterium]|nr:carboxypeptidase regulatory-like domain-containing protein [Bryobacterales bacterium]
MPIGTGAAPLPPRQIANVHPGIGRGRARTVRRGGPLAPRPVIGRLPAALLLALLPLAAQTGTSHITGRVVDASGGVVPNAAVTAIRESTGQTYRVNTTGTGIYSFPSLPAGAYTVLAELKGFKISRSPGNVLEVGTPLNVDLTLQVGDAGEVIHVESAFERLQVANAALGSVVERKALAELPLNGRNPLGLLVLEPGVVQRSAGAEGSGIHVNGSRDRAFNVTIDGIEANESTVPNPMSNIYRLNPENVQEYRVVTGNPAPEEGRNSGASISVATRSGGNTFHGTAFEFFRNTALNATDYFANALDTPKPDIKLNQFGLELGGPIRKNRTFFFGSWQGQRIDFQQPVDQVFFRAPLIYTPQALAGNYRYFVADPRNPLVLDGQTITRNSPLLVDPRTGALRPGVRECAGAGDRNCVAGYNMFASDPRGIGADPVMARLFAAYPRPNSFAAGDGLNTATYLWNSPARVRGPHFLFRLDHTFDANNTLFARWLQSEQNTLGGDPNNSRPQLFPGWPPMGEVFRSAKNLAVSYRRVVSPRIVNELTLGFSRFVYLFTQGEANPAFPDIPPFDFANVDEPFIARPRSARAVTTPQVLDNLSVAAGSHVIRLGANLRFYRHNDQRGQPGGVNVTPTLSFGPWFRPPEGFDLPAVASSSRAGIDGADLSRLQGSINDILGIPARLSQAFLGDLESDSFLPYRSGESVTLWSLGHRMKQYNFYFQDEWRLRRNLTLNYGARWEINPAPTEAAGRVYVPDRAIDGSQGPVAFVRANRWFARNNLGALAPRIGLSWAPGQAGKTVLRAGYGIAFDTLSSFQVTAVAGRVPGLTTSCSATPGGAATPGCAAASDTRIGQGFPLELPVPATKPSSYLKLPPQTYNSAPPAIVFDPSLRLPTVHQWNFTVQRELPYGLVVQAGYVGRRGTRLFRAYDRNQINAGPILPSFLAMQQNRDRGCRADGSACPTGVSGLPVPLVSSGIVSAAFVNSSTTAGELAQNAAGSFAGRIEQTTLAAGLRPNQQFSTITYLDSGGDSYYHSGQATLRRRFENGLMAGAAYAFGKSIDNQSVDPVGSTSSGGLSAANARTPADTRDWRQERARSDFDRRHALNLHAIYELPFGRGARFARGVPAPLNHLVGGWSLNAIYTCMSGEPFSVGSGVRTSNYSHESRAELAGARPEVRLQSAAGVIGPVLFAGAGAFRIPPPGGNGMGRNVFEAPGYWNLDLGVQKIFRLTETLRLQFRTEMFNAFNHVNFDNPRDASAGSPQILSTVFGHTCCAAVAPPSTQEIIQTGESARVIQLALKLQW